MRLVRHEFGDVDAPGPLPAVPFDELYDCPEHTVEDDDAISRALGVSRRRVAAWIEAGLLRVDAGPTADGHNRDVDFELDDAAVLRSLCARRDPGGRPAKLRATLDRLRAWLPPPPAEPMRRLTLVDGHGPLLVHLADGNLADATGQFRLAFGRRGAGGRPASLGRLGPPREPASPAEWHERGVERQLAGALDDAIHAYTRALLAGGPDAQVAFDLAYALAAAGERDRAVERYRQVVELDPSRQDAWVNLADELLADGRPGEAADALRRAVDLDPDDPDAHYNLADAADADGRPAAARLHWERFLRLAGHPDERTAYARHRLETDDRETR